MNLDKLEQRIIGHIDVDAGIVWIGDPCYIMHPPSPKLGKDWGEFLLGEDRIKSFDGLGVCTSTKYGDGTYPVIGFFEKGSAVPSAVLIDFDPDEE